jgi:transcriptional regulator with XRE-family HTH domain
MAGALGVDTLNEQAVGSRSRNSVVASEISALLGSRLRDLREAAGMTLTELAQAAGISKAHLSRLESGERSLSLATLLTLAAALRVPVASILPRELDAYDDDRGVVPSEGPVVRASGLQLRPLTRRKDAALQPFHVIVPAERSWSPGVTHPGEEWIYVLRGVVTVVHADRADTLYTGDSIHLDAREPHRLTAAAEAELIVVADSRS